MTWRRQSCLRSLDGQEARQDCLPHARECPSSIGFESPDTNVDAALPSPKFFTVDRVGREGYRVLGKGRDGPFAKSFFGGRVSISLFRSDE